MHNKGFNEVIDNLQEHLDALYEKLVCSDFLQKEDIKNINGVYVFYEGGKAKYVGRSNKDRLKKRISGHSTNGSKHSSASFAFRLAKEKLKQPNLSKIETYHPDFIEAKRRVSRMKIKVVEINDPFIQTIFEPYTAFKLKTTKYNSFMTH